MAKDRDEDPISLTTKRLERASHAPLPTFRLVLSFEDREAECTAEGCKDFVFGYEAGLLDGRLTAKPEWWSGTYHMQNMDMLRRVAEARGYTCVMEDSDIPGWTNATFTPVPPASPRLKILSTE